MCNHKNIKRTEFHNRDKKVKVRGKNKTAFKTGLIVNCSP